MICFQGIRKSNAANKGNEEMKVIVQAGGLGSRMKELTKNKPKALIPIFNKPILFHLFERFEKNMEFIVIGDYKFEVLDRYLTTFSSDKKILLIKSQGVGNICGIKEALKYVASEEPVLLIWSDLILPENFSSLLPKSHIKEKVLVGTDYSACSWVLFNGKLQKRIQTDEKSPNGVLGVFYVSQSGLLRNVPTEGSFTSWLSQQDICLENMPIEGCIDLGTKNSYESVGKSLIRCRPYNKIRIENNTVTKEGLTKEAITFLERESNWYRKAEEYNCRFVPKLLGMSPLKLERIHGHNLFEISLNSGSKRKVLEKVIRALKEMHGYEKSPSNPWDLYQEYFSKTLQRVKMVAPAIPFANDSLIRINGEACRNILFCPNLFRECILKNLMHTFYTFFHGDCQFTNTLIDKKGEIFFIDPRGYFGKTEIEGDVRYDWAKLYYALFGNFDQFNIKNFDLTIENNEINFSIGSGGWEEFVPFLFEKIPSSEGGRKEITLIHSIIWLSMSSHVYEDYDSMCTAFYYGTFLFEKWVRRFYEPATN